MASVRLISFLFSCGVFVLDGCAGARCGPETCATCCDSNGICATGDEDAACGRGGEACVDCTGGGACDPSLGACVNFAGTYAVSGTVTQQEVLGNTSTSFNRGVSVTLGTPAYFLAVEVPSGTLTNCQLTASIVTSNTFSVGGTCPAFADALGCTEEWSYASGNGSVEGNSLTVSLSGTYSRRSCPGGLTGSGALSATYAGSR